MENGSRISRKILAGEIDFPYLQKTSWEEGLRAGRETLKPLACGGSRLHL
jgi:hypothetical protein